MFTDLRIPADRRVMTRGETLIAGLIGGVFLALMVASVVQQFVPQKLSIVFFIIFWFLMLVLHELGHAIMARALGWRVGEMVIGFGPVLWRGRIGATKIVLKLLPIEGYVLPVPTNASRIRLKSALVYAAGPGVELVLLAVLIILLGWETVFNQSAQLPLIALKTLAIVIIWGAGFNLLPFASGGGVSDGLGILSSPFLSSQAIELRLAYADMREIDRLLAADCAGDALPIVDKLIGLCSNSAPCKAKRVEVLSAMDRHDEAKAEASRLLTDGHADAPDRRRLLHLQALVEMATPTPDMLNVDMALREALKLDPRAGDLLITRGTALVLRGQNEAGGEILADAYRRSADRNEQARALAWLTVAAYRCREPEATARFRTAFVFANRSLPLRRLVMRLTGMDKTGVCVKPLQKYR